MKMLINCYDNGLHYLVVSATTGDIIDIPVTDRVVIEVTDTSLYSHIVELLVEGKSVKLPKGLSVIAIADLIVGVTDEIEGSKNAAFVKIMNLVNKRIGNVYSYYFFKYATLNNKLLDAGYYITGDTTQTKYLEILQSGDVKLIALLEQYLEIKSKIEEYIALFDSANTAITEVDDLTTTADILARVNVFNNAWQ